MRRDRMLLALARTLEGGPAEGPAGLVARALARAWAPWAARAIVRPLDVPPGVRVVAVGGATLGGSGKTPLAIACARELARGGARVALVGHAYRASPGVARVVGAAPATAAAALAEVGDEALVAAGALAEVGVPVVVGPSRQAAVEHASTLADVLVLDGALQTAPSRAAISLLAVDADEPWGRTRALPPRGDLRAPVAALLRAADVVVAIGEPADVAPRETAAHILSRGVRMGGALVPWSDLTHLRVGLASALARPARVLRFLARRGVVPVERVHARDHGALARAPLRAPVDLWLATEKCALHVPADAARVAPLATIDHALVLSPSLRARLAARLDPGNRQQ
jgi:tetraacyldisaccharide 4'-kinase